MSSFATVGTVFHRARVRVRYFLLLALALPMLAVAGGPSSPPDGTRLLDRLPPNWRDDRGEVLRLPALQGRRLFIAMAYTSCHRFCPMTMVRLSELQRDLDALGISAEILIVSYDPGNDDPAAWHRYRVTHRLLRDNWHFLIGTVADTEQLASLLGFEFWRDGEHVMHDFRIVALDGDGSRRGVIDSAHDDVRNLL